MNTVVDYLTFPSPVFVRMENQAEAAAFKPEEENKM